MRRSILLISFLGLIMAAITARFGSTLRVASAPERERPYRTTICHLLSAKRRFDRRLVTVSACYYSDNYERAFIADPVHPCGGIGVSGGWNVPNPASYDPGKHKVCGTFTGTFYSESPILFYEAYLSVDETKYLRQSPLNPEPMH